ncbi:MAG: hypothetical protein IJP70_06730 [Bacteroidales bacterium]|nr:hypothetical protein [Bacteroidales bacterium]
MKIYLLTILLLVSCVNPPSTCERGWLHSALYNYREQLKLNNCITSKDTNLTLYFNACFEVIDNDTILYISGGDGYEELQQIPPPLPPNTNTLLVNDSSRLLYPIVKCKTDNNYICIYGEKNIYYSSEFIRKWIGNAKVLSLESEFTSGSYLHIYPTLTCYYKWDGKDSVLLVKRDKIDCWGF